MPYLKAGDIISGQEGWIRFTVNGNVEEGSYVKDFEAVLEKEKREIRTLGHRGTQHKTVGWTGTGSMNMYYITSLFRKMALEYAKNGRDLYFDIVVENDDPTSTIGRQVVAFYDCNMDSAVLSRLDVNNAELDEDADFTFGDFDILENFKLPVLGV